MSGTDRAAAPFDAHRGMARRSFLARTVALGASAMGVGVAGVGLAPTATAAAPARTAPRGRPLRFDQAAWVAPRPEAAADPTELSIAEAGFQLRRGRVSPVELVEAYLERIDAHDGTYRAYARVDAERALAAARTARPRVGGSPLVGVPLAIKDNYYTAGLETTANSYLFEGFVPPYDATAVARLAAVGGIVLGKTEMGPLATSRATTPAGVVTTVNAWTPEDPSVNPGGSSTGSATAVAGRLATSSIGTQTGGSITGPSNAQNLTGLKPTMGRASLYGIVPLTYSRDHPGPLARSAMDCAIMLTAIAGEDPNDPRTQGLPEVPNLVRAAAPVVVGGEVEVRWPTRVGVPPGYLSGSQAGLRGAFLDTLADLPGVEVVDVALPEEWDLLTGTFNAVRLPERSEPFLAMLQEDLRGFGVSLTSWLQGLFLPGAETLRGHRSKVVLLERILAGMLTDCDVVLQTSPVPFDIVGLPELALPIGFATSGGSEIPVGTILGAGPFEEERLLALAAAYQAVTDHHWRRPVDPEPARAGAARARTATAPLRLTAEEVVELTQ